MNSLETILREQHGKEMTDIPMRREKLADRIYINTAEKGLEVAFQGETAGDILALLPEIFTLDQFPFETIASNVSDPEVLKRVFLAV